MSTYTADTLSGPARVLDQHARHTAHLNSHRATITTWLQTLQLGSIEEMFDAVGGGNTAATSLLLTEHRKGNQLATTVLLGGKAKMLAAVCRHSPGEDYDERFQATAAAFLSHAVPRAKTHHPHLNAQLYWVTLRTVHNEHQAPTEVCDLPDEVAGEDVVVNIDECLTASIVLDWAQSKGLLNTQDRRALDVRFGGSSVLPVREVAHRLEVSEDGLETRLRRAMRRIRDGVAHDDGQLSQACLDALWPSPAAVGASVAAAESTLVA
jgi:hypothetical protein